MIRFSKGQLVISDYEDGKDLHVVRKELGFEFYLTSSSAVFDGFFEVPQRLVWKPDFKSIPELMNLFAFLDDMTL